MTVNRDKSSHVMKNFVQNRFLDIRFVTGSARCLRMSRHKDAIIYSMGLQIFCGGCGMFCGPRVVLRGCPNCCEIFAVYTQYGARCSALG